VERRRAVWSGCIKSGLGLEQPSRKRTVERKIRCPVVASLPVDDGAQLGKRLGNEREAVGKFVAWPAVKLDAVALRRFSVGGAHQPRTYARRFRSGC
jgi:hypothetical protein